MEQKSILIIEDEKPMARALELKLGNAGFKVEVASNGVEALAMIKAHPYDLALLDLIMPKMDGFKLLEEINATGLKQRMVVVTNLSKEVDEQRARDLGVTDFLIKTDVSLSDIAQNVTTLLGKE